MTAPLPAVALGVLGLVVGSFLGLASIRLPNGKDIVAGRSKCASCNKTLSPLQLIPVASYVLSGGRCIACRARIPLRYPLIEASAAAVGAIAGNFTSSPLMAGAVAVAGWHWLLAAMIFAEYRRVSLHMATSLLITSVVVAALLALS